MQVEPARANLPEWEGSIMRLRIVLTPLLAAMVCATTVEAQSLSIQPTSGQTPEKMAEDQAACETSASEQTGFDQMAATAPSDSTSPQAGQRAAGAVKGAAAGAVAGAVTDQSERETEDLVKGSAAVGAVSGGRKQRKGRREQRGATEEQEQLEAGYSNAFSSCMTAKGYVVQQ
jgi:hypothetical protein